MSHLLFGLIPTNSPLTIKRILTPHRLDTALESRSSNDLGAYTISRTDESTAQEPTEQALRALSPAPLLCNSRPPPTLSQSSYGKRAPPSASHRYRARRFPPDDIITHRSLQSRERFFPRRAALLHHLLLVLCTLPLPLCRRRAHRLHRPRFFELQTLRSAHRGHRRAEPRSLGTLPPLSSLQFLSTTLA